MHSKRWACSCLAIVGALSLGVSGAPPKFYDDDPVWVERDHQDASGVRPWKIELISHVLYNSFVKPGDPLMNVRAKNLNTVDEVPDSNWFTNRLGRRALTIDELVKGPDVTAGPASGRWTVIASKSDGVTPGFTIRDQSGQVWFLKFDPPGYRGMATGTEVAVTKLMWALGYFVSENHIASFHREQLVVGDGAKFEPPGGRERAMRVDDIDALLRRANRERDNSYRVVASKGLEGTLLGGFRFNDTRPDDPNDLVPHEHRRELRGYGVFAAWLNQFDALAINSLDTLVTQDAPPIKVVRHYFLDFGSTLGSGGAHPRQYWEGHETLIDTAVIKGQMLSFGFVPAKWRTIDLYESPSVGRIPRDNTKFDPERWKPRVPNPAFLRSRADDKFWAARKLAAVTDEILRAAIGAGEFGDPTSEEFLVKAVAERRDAIVRRYLPAVNPIVDPALDEGGTLTFRNAAVDARVAGAAQAYRARWFVFDNATRASTLIGEATGSPTGIRPPDGLAPGPSAFIKVELSATGGSPASWQQPVHAYFRRMDRAWRLVGFERIPGD
jgi:hypothetical protein